MQEIFGSYNCAPRKLILFRILSDSLSVIEQEDYTLHYTTLKGQIQVLIPKMFPIIRKKHFQYFNQFECVQVWWIFWSRLSALKI